MEQEAPWDEIARAWHDPAMPVAQTATRYGLSVSELCKAAKARGWLPRARVTRTNLREMGAKVASAGTNRTRKTQMRPKPAKTQASETGKARAAAAAKPRAKSVNAKTLVTRIYSTIDKELSKLEQHDGESSQDRERASRALSQMVNSLEKAVDMQREMTKANGRPQVSGKEKEALKHAEELRREIANRLERLQRKRSASG
jgi:hypothetical protein